MRYSMAHRNSVTKNLQIKFIDFLLPKCGIVPTFFLVAILTGMIRKKRR